MRPQLLSYGQHQVGCRRALGQATTEAESDDRGQQHGDGLAEHDGFRFDSADPPTEHSDAVDHRCVAVGAYQCVRIGEGSGAASVGFRQDDMREILQVDLVDDAGRRRHDPKTVQGLLPPAQKLIALAVALEFELRVLCECGTRSETIDLNGVVDDEVDRDQWVDGGGVTTQLVNRVAHSCQIDDGGYARKILKDNACGFERNLRGLGEIGAPKGDVLNVLGGDAEPVLSAQGGFQKELDRFGQTINPGDALLF